MPHMLVAVAEMERDLLVGAYAVGVGVSQKWRDSVGSPCKYDTESAGWDYESAKNGASISSLSRVYGVSRATIMRVTGDVSVSK